MLCQTEAKLLLKEHILTCNKSIVHPYQFSHDMCLNVVSQTLVFIFK